VKDMKLKLHHAYIPIIILFLFVFAQFMECLQLVQTTGNMIFLILFVFPIPVLAITSYVLIFRIRKKIKQGDE
ncbi:MAG: hypothetical protein ACXQS8_05920, partial [Candidatus Helarchaeales archaeon]